jgi:hypothetical protein
MTSCGWSQKCGDAKRDTPACKFHTFITSGRVPGNAATAYSTAFGAAGDCSSLGFSSGCPTIDDYNKAVAHMDKAYLHEGEEDWQKADSVLFNAFIWLQVCVSKALQQLAYHLLLHCVACSVACYGPNMPMVVWLLACLPADAERGQRQAHQ